MLKLPAATKAQLVKRARDFARASLKFIKLEYDATATGVANGHICLRYAMPRWALGNVVSSCGLELLRRDLAAYGVIGKHTTLWLDLGKPGELAVWFVRKGGR